MKKEQIPKIRISLIFLSCILLFFVQSPLEAAVTVAPSSLNIPRGQSSATVVRYQFNGNPSLNIPLNSLGGSFTAGTDTIELNPTPLTINIKDGIGSISETIQVPVRVIERTLKTGSNKFIYTRTFSGTGIGPFMIAIYFTITTEAGADFDIKGISLYFENRRPETVIERNMQNLRAYADIAFVGSGLLQGYWEVDGRILSYVNKHLIFGGSTTLQTMEIPSLPTFDTGTHIVQFVITNPSIGIPSPSILYFVIPEGTTCSMLSIKPLAPSDGAEVAYSSLKFEWEKVEDTTHFLIGFYNKPDSKPIFSAFTKGTFYTLPEQVLKSFFAPGQTYYWKITGFDEKNNIICENKFQTFYFKK